MRLSRFSTLFPLSCLLFTLACDDGGRRIGSGAGAGTTGGGGAGAGATGGGGSGNSGNQGGQGAMGGQGGGGEGNAHQGGAGGVDYCGNGFLDPGEPCDGADLDGESCATFGFLDGSLACVDCAFDASACSNPDPCAVATDLADPTVGETSTTLFATSVLDTSCSAGSNERVYRMIAAVDGFFEAVLVSDADLALSVRTSCATVASELSCTNNALGPGGIELVELPVTVGQELYLVIDGVGGESGDYVLTAGSHKLVCGDGNKDPGEACDDGNAQAGDGCSDLCQAEPDELEPNDDVATATPLAGPSVGLIDPEGDVDWYSIEVTAGPAQVTVPLVDLGDNSCGLGQIDSYLELYDDQAQLLAFDDDGGDVFCSLLLAPSLPVGTYYLRVSAGPASPGDTFAYRLAPSIDLEVCGNGVIEGGEQCDDGNLVDGDGCSATCQAELDELEPNGTSGTANPYVAGWVAAIDPAGDVDVVSVGVPGPASTLSAQVVSGGSGDCDSGFVDSMLDIVAPDGTSVLATDDDGGAGYCSYAQVSGLAAGTYFVVVKATFLTPTFQYGLQVSVQ